MALDAGVHALADAGPTLAGARAAALHPVLPDDFDLERLHRVEFLDSTVAQ